MSDMYENVGGQEPTYAEPYHTYITTIVVGGRGVTCGRLITSAQISSKLSHFSLNRSAICQGLFSSDVFLGRRLKIVGWGVKKSKVLYAPYVRYISHPQ